MLGRKRLFLRSSASDENSASIAWGMRSLRRHRNASAARRQSAVLRCNYVWSIKIAWVFYTTPYWFCEQKDIYNCWAKNICRVSFWVMIKSNPSCVKGFISLVFLQELIKVTDLFYNKFKTCYLIFFTMCMSNYVISLPTKTLFIKILLSLLSGKYFN